MDIKRVNYYLNLKNSESMMNVFVTKYLRVTIPYEPQFDPKKDEGLMHLHGLNQFPKAHGLCFLQILLSLHDFTFVCFLSWTNYASILLLLLWNDYFALLPMWHMVSILQVPVVMLAMVFTFILFLGLAISLCERCVLTDCYVQFSFLVLMCNSFIQPIAAACFLSGLVSNVSCKLGVDSAFEYTIRSTFLSISESLY
jgi:hypothetical protein